MFPTGKCHVEPVVYYDQSIRCQSCNSGFSCRASTQTTSKLVKMSQFLLEQVTQRSPVNTPKLHWTAIYDRVLVVPFLPFPFPCKDKSLNTEYADDWVCCDWVDRSSRSLQKSPAISDPHPTILPNFAFCQVSRGNAGKLA